MAEIQQVIVYNSAAQAHFDQMLMNGDLPNFIPVVVGVFAFFFAFVFMNVLMGFIRTGRAAQFNYKKTKSGINPQYVLFAIAAVIGGLVANWMWI